MYFLLGAYLIGSIPFGFLLGKAKGVDILTIGSGNVGATNILRIFGKKLGYLCFLLDFLKGFVVVVLMNKIVEGNTILIIFSLGAVIFGHMYSVFLKFRGGKGVATCMGGVLFMFPLSFLLFVVLWSIVFFASGYVSLASVIGGISLPFLGACELSFRGEEVMDSSVCLLFVIGLGILLKHYSNIARLLKGKEYSFKKGKN